MIAILQRNGFTVVILVHAGTQNVQQILETIIQGAVAFPDSSVNCLNYLIFSAMNDYFICAILLGTKDMLWNFEKVNRSLG